MRGTTFFSTFFFHLIMNVISKISEAVNVVFYSVSLFGLTGTLQLVQVGSLILSPLSERLMIRINSGLIGTVWKVMQYIFERRKKAHITFSGDHIPFGENALVISNHVSWTDIYLLHSVANRRNMLKNCKYFVKDSIKWLPFFGWGMWLAGFIFVRRNWTQDQEKIIAAFDKIKRLETPAWIINYVEGSRVTSKKLQESQAFSRERGYPVLRNLLLPRIKGFATCVNEFRGSHIKYVYDFTLGYRHKSKLGQSAPSMVRVHARSLWPEYEFHVHVRRFAIENIPRDEIELGHWLRQLWVEKDQFLSGLHDNWADHIDKQTIWKDSSW
ncbi:hypothetical protein RMATCC62417_15090 [Rhizopus microsporus]|nr:hypothetical protein RMATCC62417_15090 [Rhizopus microsporus]